MTFDEFFRNATGLKGDPYPFQPNFAQGDQLPVLVRVPTGLGKTAMAVLGWIWRRRFTSKETQRTTPRRLIYFLPVRVLVEQTVANANKWVDNLHNASYIPED
jgi:CRISPR-associated endonuclease/helicase Cas3